MSVFFRKIAALRTIHTKGEAYRLLFVLLAGVVGLPYLAPTPIAVGLSSLTHFNNRIAVVVRASIRFSIP